ncbi:MAG TPA: tRNA (adenosine(37)-N6)-threonylcarbamoyltransferase complex dimerization subunit type 1 TsaB [Lentimicrobium sp.]|nr:tRNA (adenosine(37)-N6)-threonylcarbamoyltransferase complex dimerization subunit type 1 TsaB [Lentimicrobium sp.]
MILAIETATRICSVALFDENRVIGLLESADENTHSSILHVLIDQLLHEHGLSIGDITAVAVSKGPGSYTGLRIGVSAAKGFCYAKNIPLIAINTLESMATGMKEKVTGQIPGNGIGSDQQSERSLYVPMIDARRMEVYSAVFDPQLQMIRETEAEIITADSFAGLRKTHTLILAGDGADKCKDILKGENIKYLEGFNASAAYMLQPCIKAFKSQRFENVAYFEPFYLKDFIAGKPRVKGL